MLIRSQSRKTLVNLECIQAISLDGPALDGEIQSETTIEAYMNDSAVIILGTYSTEEKALKVLDDIENAYMETTNVQAAYGDDYHGLVCEPLNAVFTMPEDTEDEE